MLGRLRSLRALDLRDNSIRRLPRELGALTALAEASGEPDRFEDGLRLEGNPLEDPLPALIAPGQPAATRDVLAWLRGDPVEGPDAADAPLPDPGDDAAAEPPGIPAPGAGLHVVLGDDGAIAFAPPADLDGEGSNLRRLRSLHPEMQELAATLCGALNTGNRPYAALLERAARYRALIDQELGAIDFALLHAVGVWLANARSATVAQVRRGELPPMSVEAEEAVASLLDLHGTFILATRDGMAALAAEERYRRRPEEEVAHRAAVLAFAETLQDQPDIIRPELAAAVKEAAEQIGQGDNPQRSGAVGDGAARNVAITLLAVATMASVPVAGALLAGAGGGLGGVAASWLGLEVVKKTKAYAEVVGRLAPIMDRMTEVDARAFLARMQRHARFVLRSEAAFRGLAEQGEGFGWIRASLDWLRSRWHR